MNIKSISIYAVKLLSFTLVYRLAVVVGLTMAYYQSNTSPVWPPTGIAIAALLLFGFNLWPGIAISVLIGTSLAGTPLTLSLGIALGNTLEALAAAYLLKRVIGINFALNRIRDIVVFVLVAVFCTMISATIGSLSVVSFGSDAWSNFGSIWATWWIGDLLGALVVAPFLLVWITPLKIQWAIKPVVESVLVFTIMTLVTWYVFFTPSPASVEHQAMLYVIFPFMIWAALRFGQRGAATAIVLVSTVAILGTRQSLGPFALYSINDSLILLQTFMGVVSLTSLILAAASIERRIATLALHQKVQDLATLNSSSETFLGTLGKTDLFQTICQMAVKRFEADAAWIELVNWEKLQTEIMAAHGVVPDLLPGIRQQWDDVSEIPDKSSVSIKSIKSHSITDVRRYASFAVYPLFFSEKPLGTLKLLSTSEVFFNGDRQILLQSFANLAAIAIENFSLLDRVSKGNEQLHALSQRLMKAQEEERLHLSRELHDESGQLVAGMMVQLGLLERNFPQSDEGKAYISELKRIANTIHNNLHTLAVNLRPASLDHLGLVVALQQYIKEFNRQYPITVDFETTGMEEKRVPREIEIALFRVVQESLTNVLLHAQATHVDILLALHNGKVAAVVEDNGVGFNPSETDEKHLGLFGMRERVGMLHGQMTIESSPGRGTTVKVEIPCG
jgi:signal transduction histidine kinase